MPSRAREARSRASARNRWRRDGCPDRRELRRGHGRRAVRADLSIRLSIRAAIQGWKRVACRTAQELDDTQGPEIAGVADGG
jgi:hypothetical protein